MYVAGRAEPINGNVQYGKRHGTIRHDTELVVTQPGKTKHPTTRPTLQSKKILAKIHID